MNRIVLFDIDGTLLRRAGPHHKEALIAGALDVMGVECTLEGVETAGRLDRDLLCVMLTNAGIAKRRIALNLTHIMEASQNHYSERCRLDLSVKLCPGVKQTLEFLSAAHVPMGLVTGNLSAIGWRKLELAGIHHYFSFGAFAEQGTSRARLAQLALRQARKKGLARKGCHVTLVGDHANDIEAAHANEFRSVAVATGVMQPDELAKFNPDLILNSLEGATLDTLFGDLLKGSLIVSGVG